MTLLQKIQLSALRWALSRPCGPRVARSGAAGRATNCFQVYIDQMPFLWVQTIDPGGDLNCLIAGGNGYGGDNCVVSATQADPKKFKISHFWGLKEFEFRGLSKLAFSRFIPIVYWVHRCSVALDQVAQYLFNRGKLVPSQRVDVLRHCMSMSLDAQSRQDDMGRILAMKPDFSEFDLMAHVYGYRWYNHALGMDRMGKLQFMLQSLVETNDVVKSSPASYCITGSGIASVEAFEHEQRKHAENITLQRSVLGLTVVAAILTAAQANGEVPHGAGLLR